MESKKKRDWLEISTSNQKYKVAKMIHIQKISSYILCILIIQSLISCTSSNDEIAEKAKSVLASSLKDPSSATYKNVYILQFPKPDSDKGERVWMVCGEVNSKNSLGGYAGYQKFTVRNDSTEPLYEGQLSSVSDKDLFNLTYENCKSSTFSKAWK